MVSFVHPPIEDLPTRLIARLRVSELPIPPYPAVAAALERLSPAAAMHEVAAIVASDPALAAAVLREAGSAALVTNAPPTLEAALGKLGLDELRRVVLAIGLGATAARPGPLVFLRRDQWRRSLLAAMFCKELAARRRLDPQQAFVAGLLHDFGGLVALACLERLDGPLPVLPEATWRRLVDDLHVEFGMVVAARWGLPEAVSEAIAGHHAPQACTRAFRPLVELVAIVDRIIDILDRGAGISALSVIADLRPDERSQIGALVPKVAALMASFETPAPRDTPSSIARPSWSLEGSWPVDFAVEGNRTELRACAMTTDELALTGPVALQPGWLTELTLHASPDRLKVLANVRSCEPLADGRNLIIVRPYGLGGDDKATWLRLMTRTRQAANT